MKRIRIKNNKELVCTAIAANVYFSNKDREKIERKKYIINQLKK